MRFRFSSKAKHRPKLAWSDNGTPLFHVDEWSSRPSDVRDPRAYLVIVRGDSMEPMIKRGMRAIVSPIFPSRTARSRACTCGPASAS